MSFTNHADNDDLPSTSYSEETPIKDLIHDYDWASTSLGPVESWDSSLKSAVSICIHSVFPMAIYYGDDLVFIYNQMWRPILKMKHPSALGKTFGEVWPEIYDKFMKLFQEVKASGKGTSEDDTKLFLQRDGYNEETYFSFALNPIFNGDTVTGILAVVQETTEKVLGARRLKVLSELGNNTPGTRSVENACHLLTSTLREHNADIPYSLVYLIENKNNSAKSADLIATTFDEDLEIESDENGVKKCSFVKGKSRRSLPDYFPRTYDFVDLTMDDDDNITDSSSTFSASSSDLTIPKINKEVLSEYGHPLDLSDTSSSTWPLKKVLKSSTKVIVKLKNSSYAIIFPVYINSGGKLVLTAIMICGINIYRTIDNEYIDFLKLVMGHANSAMTHGRSREEEREQAAILEDLNRQKIMFFQNVSHELRTPLTLMLSPLDEAVTIYTSAKYDTLLTHLNMAQRNSRRLLKFSRIEAGRLEAIYRETDISKLTIELASCFESMAQSLNLQYNIEIIKPEIFNKNITKKVYLDKDMYEKIVFNICSNAFKHTWEGSVTIRLYVDKKDDKEIVIFEVSDTGVGIPENDLPNLFQRFYRVESKQSRSHEGTGIGLALVRELINLHGGDISVESKIDVGSTFKIWIPTGFEHLPLDRVIFGASPSDRDIQMLNIIENDRRDRTYLTGILFKDDFKVYSASDGKDALAIVKSLKKLPDLVLSDIMMPNMNGIELLNALRSDPRTQSIPVILLSAKAGEEARLNNGADDYLTKPFQPKELIARVRANIKLSNLRQKLYNQRRQQNITKELLFTISKEIHSENDLQGTLSNVIKEIHKIFDCDRILIYADKVDNPDNEFYNVEVSEAVILAQISKDEREFSCVGKTIDYHEERINIQTDPRLLDGHISEIDGNDYLNNEHNNNNNASNNEGNCEYIGQSDDVIVDQFEMPNYYFSFLKERVSLYCILIIVKKKRWGWISFHRPAHRNFNDSEKIFLQQIANQISLAITHSKLLEEKLKREAQIEAAKVASDAKNQILANTSHELRTPLGAIIGVLSAFEETPLTDEQMDMVQIMTRASDVVLSVINDILDAAKMGAQKISLANKIFDVFDLMERTIEMFSERAGLKGIELILDYGSFDIEKSIKSDPERLQQVLMNLLLNAIKFTENGEITVEVSVMNEENSENKNGLKFIDNYCDIKKKKKDVLLFKVSDTGIGFIQCDASMTRPQDGIGLGLAICKYLVTINGGKLGVESELGKGSTFWFTWIIESSPLSSVPTTPAMYSSSPSSLSSLTTTDRELLSSLRSKKVLIIDHIAKSRNRLIKILGEISEKVVAFDIIEKGIEESKKWRQSHNRPLYDMVFVNVKEETYKEQEKLINELSSLNQQNNPGDCSDGDSQFYVVIMLFWSVSGRIISKKMMSNIHGKKVALCKPVMKNKFLACLRNNELFKSSSPYSNNDDPTISESIGINADENIHKLNNSSSFNVEGGFSVSCADVNNDGLLKRKSSIDNDEDHLAKSRSRVVTKTKRILCVEDNPINLRVIQHQLIKLGYPSLTATNGQEAVDIVKSEFLNENFSSSNGFDASKEIKLMKPPASNIPIIALTASASEGTKAKCLESGMDDYVTKPLKLNQLGIILNKWLDEEGQQKI
ncbi:11923_t:CDS:10 [Entrophospora sp. SA101]|nr:11923_t:CDS:10 [Entrophospora sp. SA101]